MRAMPPSVYYYRPDREVSALLNQWSQVQHPSSAGPRKLMTLVWYFCEFDCWLGVQLYHWYHAEVVTFGGSGGIHSMESMLVPGS